MAVLILLEARMGSKSLSISRRVALAAAALIFGEPAAAHGNPAKILFICQAGTVKSAIARELFRKLAAARGLTAIATSRGIVPEDHMTPALAAALKADGIDLSREPVRQLTQADLSAADIVAVFNPLPPSLGAWKVRDWTDVPSMNENYPAARAALLAKLETLLVELTK